MSKTVPQLKKIDRSDPDKVEVHSQPYAWQKKQAPVPGAPKQAEEQHIATIRIGKPGGRRTR